MTAEDERRPIADILPGMELHPSPEGWSLSRVRRGQVPGRGRQRAPGRTGPTHRLNREELLGASVVHPELLRQELVGEWADESD